MPEVLQPPLAALTRRDRFREYMKRLNPTASARDAIEAGLVVDDLHGSLYQKLAVRADLEPGSQQLLAGGVGSGKTTQLLLAADWLRPEGKSIPLYVDVAEWTELGQVRPGALVAAFGIEMANLGLNRSIPGERDALLAAREILLKFPFDLDEASDGAGGPPYFPLPPLKKHFPWAQAPFDALFDAFRKASLAPIALFDGLDRLLTPERFWMASETDLAALRQLGFSVVLAAPVTVLFERGRSVADRFDRVYHLPPLLDDPARPDVLRAVLDRRGLTDILGPAEAELIRLASGGVLRDLISLGRDAGEEAYISGASRVERSHAHKAIGQLGTGYLRGLGPEEIRALSALARTGSFEPHSELNLRLLATRRVLEYSPTDFRVHPALLPLIREAEARVA